MGNRIRDKVRSHYGRIASKAAGNKGTACCCSGGCACNGGISDTSRIYGNTELGGLPEEAVNASLGCANPFVFADLKPGETVLDLGSGGGIDVLAASKYVGDTGKVYGLDMTDEMLRLANTNRARMGVANVEFLKGYIEDIPLPDDSVDVILSNCVINLSEDKPKALREAYRVLKSGGRLALADIVTLKPCPEKLRRQVELWFECIAGALDIGEYKRLLELAGFRDVIIEPAQVYTKEVIDGFAGNDRKYARLRRRMDIEDGIFASALIKARK